MNNKIEQIVTDCYRQVTEIGVFDIVKGNEPTRPSLAMQLREVPEYIYNYLMQENYGCCFVFSFALCYLLHKNGMQSEIVYSKEGKDIRVSVLYKMNGELFIANPVEDVEYFTTNNIEQQNRNSYYKKSTATFTDQNGLSHNNSNIPIKEFVKNVGGVAVLGNPYKSNEQMLGAHKHTVNVLFKKIDGNLIDSENVDIIKPD